MGTISIWVGKNSLFSTVSMLLDAFSIAGLWYKHMENEEPDQLFKTRIVTIDGNAVKGFSNIHIEPDGAIDDIKQTDCIVICPSIPNVTAPPEIIEPLGEWVGEHRRQGAEISSVCTGSFLLAQMGLLDGKKATTNWQYARRFKRLFPEVNLQVEHMLTQDDGIICTGAATAVNYLAMHLIEEFGNHKLASACSKALLIDPSKNSQAPYKIWVPRKNHGDSQVLKAQDQIEEKYFCIESVDAIAKDVGISPRHFKRRFKNATGVMPLKYLQRVRINAAREKLESTKDSIDQITWAVGYKDVSSFCRLFKQHTRISPKAYRDKFFNPPVINSTVLA